MTQGAPSCGSCGAPVPYDELRPVYRVYLATDGQGRVTGEDVVPDVEQWCVPCRTLYPNRAADVPDRPDPAVAPGRTEAAGTEGAEEA